MRADRIFGHITGSGPVLGRPITLDLFLSHGLRKIGNGQQVPTGILTAAGGLPLAEVTAWVDRFGIACSGRLLRPAAMTASAVGASLHGGDPWPKWTVLSDAAHLISVEVDRSRPPVVAGVAGADARQRAEARIAAARREHALSRVNRARR